MSAEGVLASQNVVAAPNKSKSKTFVGADSNATSNLLDSVSKKLNESSDSAAVFLSISPEGFNMMTLSISNKSSTDLDSVLLESFSDSTTSTESRQREIAKTVADVIRPYDSIEETRGALLDQSIEISTPIGNREVNGLSIKLAYELNSYLSSFGANNQFFTRLENSIKSNNVVDNPIVDKVLDMVGSVKKGNEINIDDLSLQIDFNTAIDATFEQFNFKPTVDYSDAQKQIEERLLTYDTIYEDSVRNSATLNDETMNMLFADETDDANDAIENEERRVNAGREILKRTLMIRESIDRTNEIIKSLAFKDALRHLDDEDIEATFPEFFMNHKEGDQDGNRNSI